MRENFVPRKFHTLQYHLLSQAKALNKCDLCTARADQYIPVHVNTVML